jgi:hypothetical protein
VTGAILWSGQYGSPVLASELGCADLSPNMGITSTPAVDQSTDTEYLVNSQYISGTSGPQAYYVHALNLDENGAEQPGFPVEIQGNASNDSQQTFNAEREIQRPGLLLLGVVVYAAFASHCEINPYQGWISGVSEAGQLTTMWTDSAEGTSDGGGIWMSGGGLVPDGPGTILFTSGNGASNGDTPGGTIPGDDPPADLGESVVRLHVQPDGSLKAVDFFAPYDAPDLDGNDLDFGADSPVDLPTPTSACPPSPIWLWPWARTVTSTCSTATTSGARARDPAAPMTMSAATASTAGCGRARPCGPATGDGSTSRPPRARPAAEDHRATSTPYQYGVNGSGVPALSLSGLSPDAFGFGSSALSSPPTGRRRDQLWYERCGRWTAPGCELSCRPTTPCRWTAAPEGVERPGRDRLKFNPPGVGDNRLYVGTRDGYVIGFGAPVRSAMTAPPPTCRLESSPPLARPS